MPVRWWICLMIPYCSRRVWTSSKDFWLKSMPIHRRCRRYSTSAATHVVAHPQKGSSTISPGLLLARIIRAKSASGFCVGYPTRSLFFAVKLGMSIQILLRVLPFCSSRYRLYRGTFPGRICTIRPALISLRMRFFAHRHVLVTPMIS